jgi:hypothetical protein
MEANTSGVDTADVSVKDTARQNEQDKPRMEHSLSRNVKVKVSQWQGEIRVDIRKYQDEGWPTKKGVSLTLARYKMLIDKHYENILNALERCQAGQLLEKIKFHLGGGFYASVTPGTGYCSVDIRKYFRLDSVGDMLPTKKGVFLSVGMLKNLKQFVHPRILACTPEYLETTPCCDLHPIEFESALCQECNPGIEY